VNALTPLFAQAIDALRQDRAAEAAKKDAARIEATARRPVVTAAGGSPIETYNAAHRIPDLLVKYGYDGSPNGQDWRSQQQQSGSYATRVYVRDDGSEEFVTLSESDAAAGIGVKTASGARRGDAFDLYAFYEHGGNRNAALMAWQMQRAKLEAERRQAQREVNAEIGAGPQAIPLTQILPVAEMLESFAFIRDGSQVADVHCPRTVLNLSDFRNALAGSKHQVDRADGGSRAVPAVQVWLESPERMQADTLTFQAGAGLMTRCPSGRQALNIWRPHDRGDVPDNCWLHAHVFVNHVANLWGADADVFLDWLAHIQQKPGELPHFGWLHISRLHGTGRNWVASVLARLWTGNVAASLDLAGLLDGNFNDRLSQCLLAIVDEVNEGGSQKYKTANKLRQLVTPEVREINPKYGRRRMEHNAARWLIFSNHTGALPLDEHDRRFWVVSHEGAPKEAYYYVGLYGLLHDAGFIASVGEFLRQRDISGFNPGQRPPMNAAKTALVEFSQSAEDAACTALVTRWPVALITNSELNQLLPIGSDVSKPAVRHAMDRCGIKKVKSVRCGGKPQIIYAVRNHASWKGSDADHIRAEIDRASTAEKTSAMGDCDA
jgi:hypothetical protein